jgi:hypothetical protein
MAELVPLDRLKTYLEIAATDTGQDVLLQDLNKRLSAWVEQYCDRRFAKATYTEQQDGDGTDVVVVTHWPMISVASLYDDPDRVFGAGTLIAPADYVIYKDEGRIQLDGLTFSRGLQNVKVTYDAGYAEIPPDLQQAVCELIADRFRHKEHQGLRSLSIGAYSVGFTEAELPEEVRAILDSYRRIRVA